MVLRSQLEAEKLLVSNESEKQQCINKMHLQTISALEKEVFHDIIYYPELRSK